ELQTNGVERQLLDNSCGISSLSYILNKYFKKNTSEKNIFLLIGLKPDYSLLDLASTSRTLGISTIGLKLS
ncbi:cysteine peptidase family C39 domain-containing protein, partial [Escherichia coli]